MILKSSYVHLLVLSGLFMFCTPISADICHEPYRLLDECSTYPPFITSPGATHDLEEISRMNMLEQQLIDSARFAPTASFSPQRGIEEALAKGRGGSAQVKFGTTGSSYATTHRNSEIYRVHGLFAFSVSHGS